MTLIRSFPRPLVFASQMGDSAETDALAPPSFSPESVNVVLDTAVLKTSSALDGFNITICGGGGIGATELPKIARELRRMGANVKFVVTENALKFIGVTALEWASSNPVTIHPSGMAEHIFEGDAILVAPATADLIAKAAHGICCDSVTTLLQSAFGRKKPVFFLPTMHESLAFSPFVSANIGRLDSLGHVYFLEPRREENKLKSPLPKGIALEMAHRLNSMKNFAGRSPHAAITLGGTRVSIDSVRCLTNISSGSLGMALAEKLYSAGIQLLLLKCQTYALEHTLQYETSNLQFAKTLDVPEYQQLKDALMSLNEHNTNAIFHLAAVSDFAPLEQNLKKISGDSDQLVIRLQKTQKLLQLENLKNIRFQMACKLTDFGKADLAYESKQGLATAKRFCEVNNLSMCLWNAAKESLGCKFDQHQATLLIPPTKATQMQWQEVKVQGKTLIAEVIAKAFLSHMADR